MYRNSKTLEPAQQRPFCPGELNLQNRCFFQQNSSLPVLLIVNPFVLLLNQPCLTVNGKKGMCCIYKYSYIYTCIYTHIQDKKSKGFKSRLYGMTSLCKLWNWMFPNPILFCGCAKTVPTVPVPSHARTQDLPSRNSSHCQGREAPLH